MATVHAELLDLDDALPPQLLQEFIRTRDSIMNEI
jgi:hypothetical protein